MPALRAVPEQVARPARAPFVVLVVGVLGAGLVGLLLLNIVLAQDSYRLHRLQQTTGLLAEQQARLQQQVAAQSAPASLAAKAERLGMVPAGPPAFLEVPNGKVRGEPEPATRSGQGSTP